MLTYQDLLEVPETDQAKIDFVYNVIFQHKASDLYQEAVIADEYDRKRNRTIETFVKMLYTTAGEAVPDRFSVNFRMGRAFFPFFITQEVQYLLGNGVSWQGQNVEVPENTEGARHRRLTTIEKNGEVVYRDVYEIHQDSDAGDKLGTKEKPFDTQLQLAGHKALVGAVSFGFYNLDHVDVFGVDEFAPLYDEENGSLRSGVRFWQLDASKPLRATLYEEDGYTDYIWNARGKDGSAIGQILHDKRPYKQTVKFSEADGMEIVDGTNYPGFPIVPLWGNKAHQSELVGLREQIDCYDLIKSGFANNVDEASYVYWAIQNAGGMDDIDLAKFVEHMKTVHAANVEDAGAHAEPHTMEAPYASREALLSRLERDIFKDAMALDIENIAAGANTATQIRAAYEPLNEKTDGFEYCVISFIRGLMAIAGIDDEPSFTRSAVANIQEEITTILTAAGALPQEYVIRKVLTILGDGDKADDIIDELHTQELERGGLIGGEEAEEEEEVAEDVQEEAEAAVGKPLNGAQTHSLITILGQYQQGALSEKQAIKIMSSALGISAEDAADILHA